MNFVSDCSNSPMVSMRRRRPSAAGLILLVAALMLAAACSDDAAVEDNDNNNRFSGPIPPEEVQVSPGQGPAEGPELANVPRPLALPSAGVGLGTYSANLAGTTASEIRAGPLPPGLTLEQGGWAGDGEPGAGAPGEVEIFTFEVAPDDPNAQHVLEAQVAVYGQGVVQPSDKTANYWEDGPYGVWSTQPLPTLNENPQIDAVGPHENIDLYISYPTIGEPTETGDGSVAPGRWPVVVFAHANNDRVCDINEGYYTLHDHWASWGYIVVAVDGTTLNCQRGNVENIELRSEGQRKALDVLETLHNDPESRFFGRVDLTRIVMAGHSRGGGASLRSAMLDDRIRGIIDIQGVDMTSFGFGSAPLPPVPTIGLTAGEDVDLNYPIVEPTEDQSTSLITWVNINGGIHAYTGDGVPLEPDDVPLIERAQQHDITEYFTTAFLARFVGVGDGQPDAVFAPQAEADPVLFSHYGAEQVDEQIADLGVYVRWNRRLPGVLIDDFDDLQTGTDQGTNALGGANTSEGFGAAEQVVTYLPEGGRREHVYQKATSLRLIADQGPGTFRLALGAQGVVAEPGQILMARVKGPDSGTAGPFQIEIETTDGALMVDGSQFIGPEPLSNRFTQLSIPLERFGVSGQAVEIVSVAIHLESGTLFVDDLRIH